MVRVSWGENTWTNQKTPHRLRPLIGVWLIGESSHLSWTNQESEMCHVAMPRQLRPLMAVTWIGEKGLFEVILREKG